MGCEILKLVTRPWPHPLSTSRGQTVHKIWSL